MLPVLLLAAPVLAGEPILLPDLTPGTTSEFGVAFMLQERVVESLTTSGHLVLTAEAAAPVVGPTASCADRVPDCPRDELNDLPARVAVVIRVEREGASLRGQVMVFVRGEDRPADVRTLDIESGFEHKFADAVAVAVGGVVRNLPPPDPDERFTAEQLVASVKNNPAKNPDLPKEEPDGLEAKLAAIDLRPRHVAGARGPFEKWRGPALEWFQDESPHAGRFVFEVRAGIGYGDVGRRADVRVDVEAGETETWWQEGPQIDTRWRGAVYAGYAPNIWVEGGISLGLQYGRRDLTTYWTTPEDPEVNTSSDSVQAAQFELQPRVRFFPVPLGLLKAYAVLGADVRVFDNYKIADTEILDYPEPWGGVVPGVVGGLGILVDPNPMIGFFGEISYIRHFGSRSQPAQLGVPPADPPAPPFGRQQTLGFVGGVQFRI